MIQCNHFRGKEVHGVKRKPTKNSRKDKLEKLVIATAILGLVSQAVELLTKLLDLLG